MWYFSQSTGIIRHDDETITAGYAGNGFGKNNPGMQDVHNVGPLPQGVYQIQEPIQQDVRLGHYVMPLAPSMENTMFGRSGFYWHGDNPAHIGESSDGCIVTGLQARIDAWSSGDHMLTVTA